MAWMTLPEAAVTTGTSVRTVHRRILAGQLRTRRSGRRTLVEVHVGQPSPLVGSSVPVLSSTPATDEHSNGQVNGNGRSGVQDNGHGSRHDPDWARLAVDAMATSLERTQRSARWAWSGLAAAVLMLAVGGWQYHRADLAHRDEAGRLNAIIAGMESRTVAMADGLEQARLTQQNLQDELLKVRMQLASESTKLEQADQDRRRLAGDLEGIRVRLDETHSSLALARGQVATLTSERDRLVAQTAGQREQLDRQGVESSELKTQLAVARQERDAARSETAALRSTVETHKAGFSELRARLENVIASHREVVSELQTLRCRLDEQSSVRIEAAQSLELVVGQLHRMTAERDQLAGQVEHLRAVLATGQVAGAIRNLFHTPVPVQTGREASPRQVEYIEPVQSPSPADAVEQGPPRKGMKITVSVPTTRPAGDRVIPPSEVPLNRTACAAP